MNFIVDTNIWKTVSMINDSKLENREQAMTCLQFLSTFYYVCRDVIVLDTENIVYKEYADNINNKSLAFGVYKNVLFRKKVMWISKDGLNICDILNGIPFDPDDIKFLELNAKLGGKNTVIISIDSDFVNLKKVLNDNENLRSRLQNPIIMGPEEILGTYYKTDSSRNGPK